MDGKKSSKPLIIAFVSDLMFTTRIENTIRRLEYEARWIGSAGELGPADSQELENAPGEPVHGRAARLMEQITEWQPALLIFDLGNEAIPWRSWIAILKSSPATRRLPILCYGPHVEVEQLTLARKLGADEVVARSRFTSAMADLIAKHARLVDRDSLNESCQEPLPELALKGLELFNQGEYYECHEAFEDAWNEDQSVGRDLYRGILQIAVAYLQIERGNYAGAVKMFLRARQWLDSLPDRCRQINVAQLRQNAAAVHEALLALGPDRLAEFDQNLFRPIEYERE